MVKVNDIIANKQDTCFASYGRVSRIFNDGRVETIDCGKYIRVCYPDDLEIYNDYTGYWSRSRPEQYPLFIRMPSLRRLKRMAAHYDKTVWKKYRKGEFCEYTRFMDKLP